MIEKLKLATQWLSAEVDQISGHVANYGHNDGAYLFPFTNGGYTDYRPVIQAASKCIFKAAGIQAWGWDEMALWFGVETMEQTSCREWKMKIKLVRYIGQVCVVGFTSCRPGHADQNHVDLWWKGEPIALDGGTYRYNADSPWDNQLMATAVHNTIT